MNPLDWYKDRQNRKEMSAQRQLRKAVAQGITGAMILAAILYFLVAGVVGMTAFNPTSGSDALTGAHDPAVSTWTAEAIHTIKLTNGSARLDSIRSVTYDLKRNRFQAYVRGVLPIPTAFSSDGTTSLYLTQTDRDLGRSWRLLNDVCHKAPAISAELVKMPSGKDLAAGGKSSWANKDALFKANKAWQVHFTPSLDVIKQLMLVGFLDRVGSPRSSYALSDGERAMLEKGKYSAEGSALVTKSDRIVSQIEVSFTITGFGNYHILATRSENILNDPLSHTNFGSPSC